MRFPVIPGCDPSFDEVVLVLDDLVSWLVRPPSNPEEMPSAIAPEFTRRRVSPRLATQRPESPSGGEVCRSSGCPASRRDAGTASLGETRLRVCDEGSGTGNQVLWYLNHLEYDAYGNVTSVDDPSTGTANDGDFPGLEGVGNEYSPQRSYTGREPDPATGPIYYRVRWFYLKLGRCISDNPMGFAAEDANFSRYAET